MARLEAVAAWFFNCLGVTLLGVSVLVVPANAFADAGGCEVCIPGSEGYDQCVADCCNGSSGGCNGDPTCVSECCTRKCQDSQNPQSCLTACGRGVLLASSCLAPDINPCFINDNTTASACRAIGCSILPPRPLKTCDCKWEAPKCICPL
jgi:hypothetical protein